MRPIAMLAVVAAGLIPGVLLGADGARMDSPKATMKTLLTFLRQGQLERVPECFVAPRNEQEEQLLLYGLKDDAYLPAVHEALAARFGAEASPLAKVVASLDQQLQVVDSLVQTDDGLNGRLAVRGREKLGLDFVKLEDKWRIALTPGFLLRPVPPEKLAVAEAVRQAYLDTVRDIKAGKFKTAEAAMAALDARRQAAVGQSPPQAAR